MTRTVAEIAKALDVTDEAARGLLLFLRYLELAQFRGERPSERGGKGAHVYRIAEGAAERVRGLLLRVEG